MKYLSGSYAYQFPLVSAHVKRYYQEHYDHNRLIVDREKIVEQFRNRTVRHLSRNQFRVTGLENFPHFYITNGISQFIDTAIPLLKLRPESLEGEYPGYSYVARTAVRSGIPLTESIRVVSAPFYPTGDIHKETDSVIADGGIVDLAWAANYNAEHTLDVSNAQFVAYSYSKTFGIQYHRIGVVFAKQRIPGFELYQPNHYFNLAAVDLVDYLLDAIPENYLDYLYRPVYNQIVEEKELTPTPSLWFARTKSGDKYPLFSDYKQWYETRA
jgi:hypothetical protein